MKTSEMNLTPDRQGYLGNLSHRSIPELQELLDRQEHILKSKHLLATLPDKGDKARAFAAYLRQLLEERLAGQSTWAGVKVGGLGQKHAGSSETKDKYCDTVKTVATEEEHDGSVGYNQGPVNRKEEVGRDQSMEKSVQKGDHNSLVLDMENLTLGTILPTKETEAPSTNSYERVIKKAVLVNQKPKFLPNRTLISHHIPSPPWPCNTQNKKITDTQEESAVKPPSYKFQNSQLIPIEESVKLIEHHRTLNEELLTQRAAQRLADNLLSISENLHYREPVKLEQDSDDDEDDDVDDDSDKSLDD